MNQGVRGAAGYDGHKNGGESASRFQAMQAKGAKMGDRVRERINSSTHFAKRKAREIAADQTIRVAAASGLGGAVVVGAGGAGAGLLAGGAAGAAIGILPALFTFGLSIPIGAVIGGTCGTVVGAATGGTVGLTGGSAIGYGAYKKRAQIRSLLFKCDMVMGGFFRRTMTKMSYYADLTKKRTAVAYYKTKMTLRMKMNSARAKLSR